MTARIYGFDIRILDPKLQQLLLNEPKFDWSLLPPWPKKPKETYKWRMK